MEIDVNIERSIKDLIEKIRNQYQLSEIDYSDERIKSALEDNNYDIENAFVSLIYTE